MSESIHVIAAVYPDEKRAREAIAVLQRMHGARTITLLGVAMATEDDQGRIQLDETRELAPREAAKRWAIAGAVFGLIFPPSALTPAAAAGAREGGGDTRFRRDRLEAITDQLRPGTAAVVILADDEWVLPIQQALVGYEGTLFTEPLDEDVMALVSKIEAPGAVAQDVAHPTPRSTGDRGTREDNLARVQRGMTAVDAAGETVGHVSYVKLGDREAVTAGAVEDGDQLAEAVTLAFGGNREPNVPDDLAERLLCTGYIKIDERRPLRPDHHYYAAADEIASVTGDSVRLTRRRRELITPEE